MKQRFLPVLLLAVVTAVAAAEPIVIRDAREWRQTAAATGFTWDEIAAACPTNGYPCTGQIVNGLTLATVDVDGWTWARRSDIRDLFDSVIQYGVSNFPTDSSNYGGVDDPDIQLVVSGAPCWFDPTTVEPAGNGVDRWLNGWSAYGTVSSGLGGIPQLRDLAPGSYDAAVTYLVQSKTMRTTTGDRALGIWMFRPLQAVTRAFMVLPLPDVDSDGVADVAVVIAEPTRAEVRSGGTGALLQTMTYFEGVTGSIFNPVDAEVVPDSDGDGAPELAVLARRLMDGRGVVELRNLAGAAAPRQVWFAGCRKPVALAVVDTDADGNGLPELAVLSIGNRDGRAIVEVKNAYGPTQPTTLWVGAGLTPTDIDVVADADANGVPEVAVLATRDSDHRVVVEIKNAAGTTNPNSVWFMAGHTAIDLAVVPDANGNGVPEVAVLSSRDADGRLVVEIKNAAGPTNPTAVWFAAGQHGVALKPLPDTDGNSVPELAVLSTRSSDGRVLVEVKNGAGSTNPRSLWYPAGYTALDLAVCPDLDANGVEEAGVFMRRDSDGRMVVETRNTSGPQLPRDYWFSQLP